MAIKRTRNSGLTVPSLEKGIVGGDEDKWGDKWNGNIDKLYEFHTKLVQDSETQNQEIRRIDTEKVSKSDVPTIVEPIVDQFLETNGKPMLDDYMNTTIKPQLNTYTSGKKAELDNYVNLTSKPSLDSYEKVKESELNSYTTTKKGELDSHTLTKQTQLDNYEKTKENQLNSYTSTKQIQLDSYTNTKKSELDAYEETKEGELNTFTSAKKTEITNHTNTKKGELDTYTTQKKGEITTHTNTKKGELDTYTTQKKGEITTHTDSEIERINADSELANKANKTVQVIAGNGLVGGGDLSTNRTLNIASADDGIIVNADNIKLNIVDNATTDSATRAGSARQIKLLSEGKVNKTDIVDNLTTADKSKVLSANMGKYLEDNKWRINSKSIPKGTDLNELIEGGNYISIFSENSIVNAPTSRHMANLIVVKNDYSTEHITQIWISHNNKSIYVRYLIPSNIWTDWEEILKQNSPLFLGTQGISSIIYIQDAGQKTAGNGYVDKTTGKLYRCVNTTTDTTVTTNFELATNIDNSSRLALIEERLGIYSPVGKIQSISVSRNEDSSSPTLTYSSV